jgi:hypothetical protein
MSSGEWEQFILEWVDSLGARYAEVHNCGGGGDLGRDVIGFKVSLNPKSAWDTQTNLQANTPGIAEATDPQLVNSWGLSRTSGSAWWVADNVTGVATLYNGPGTKQSLTVTIPPADPNNKKTLTGSPTGIIANGSITDFVLAQGAPADFIFATLDGTIAAWNPNVALRMEQHLPLPTL